MSDDPILAALSRLEAGQATTHADIAALREGQAGTHADIAALREGQAATHADIAALREGQAATHADIAALREGQAAGHADIAALRAAQDRLETGLNALRRESGDFREQVLNRLTSIRDDIGVNMARVDRVASTHTDIRAELLSLRDENAALWRMLKALETRVDQIEAPGA